MEDKIIKIKIIDDDDDKRLLLGTCHDHDQNAKNAICKS